METPYTMKESAIAMHELYINLRNAGFSRREALVLVSVMLVQKPLEP